MLRKILNNNTANLCGKKVIELLNIVNKIILERRSLADSFREFTFINLTGFLVIDLAGTDIGFAGMIKIENFSDYLYIVIRYSVISGKMWQRV